MQKNRLKGATMKENIPARWWRKKNFARPTTSNSWRTLPRAMEPDDVRRLLRKRFTPRDKCMILMLLRSGMRVSELLAVKLQDVNLAQRTVTIQESAKMGNERIAYLSDDAYKALRKWMKVRRAKTSIPGSERPLPRQAAIDSRYPKANGELCEEHRSIRFMPSFQAHYGNTVVECGCNADDGSTAYGPRLRFKHPTVCQGFEYKGTARLLQGNRDHNRRENGSRDQVPRTRDATRE